MTEQARRHEAASPPVVDALVGAAAGMASMSPAASFDMVTSCMALQDMPDVPAVLRAVRAVLRFGGRLVASITHPCTDTPFREWQRDETGRKRCLCVDRYFDRVAVEYTWRGWAYNFSTPAVHAPLELWFAWIIETGFELRSLREPRPTEEAVRAKPDLEDAAKVPYYLIFDLVRGE